MIGIQHNGVCIPDTKRVYSSLLAVDVASSAMFI